MQQKSRMVFAYFLGLILFLFPFRVEGKVIYDQFPTDGTFDFQGFNRVVFSLSLNNKKFFLDELSLKLGNRGKVLVLHNLETEIIEAIGRANLFFFACHTETTDSKISFLRLEAKAGSQIKNNQDYILSPVWSRFFILEGENTEQETRVLLEKSIAQFLEQYFAKGQENPIFYYFDPLNEIN